MESVKMESLDLEPDVLAKVILLFVDFCTCYYLISNHLSVLSTSKTAISFLKPMF